MRTLKALFCTFILFIAFLQSTFSQEQLGLRLESYSGVNSLGLNPANGPSSSFRWDLNLVGVGLFGQSNYGYAYNTNVPEILRTLPEVDAAAHYNSENQYPENTLIVDYSDNSQRKYVNLNALAIGPSLMINLESGHSFGVFSNFRAAVSSQDIPHNLNYYFFNRTPIGQEFTLDAFDAAVMTWSEIGINYARRVETTSGNLDIGGSIKFLNGYEAAFLDSKKSFGLTQFSGDSLNFSEPNLAFGFTTSNADGENVSLQRNGGGVAFDIGAVMTIDGFGDDYEWKFGAALLDIGRINFNRNAESHTAKSDQDFILPSGDYDDVETLQDAVALFSQQSLGDSSLTLTSQSFNIWLPGALSLQADYNVAPNLFVNATLIQRLPYKSNAVKRGNLLAVTPRFEHRWLSAALPVSLYNYRKFRVGAAVRLAFLTIGTDHFGSFVGKSDFTGSDFYIALKVNPFNLGFKLGGRGRRGGKNVKCYEF